MTPIFTSYTKPLQSSVTSPLIPTSVFDLGLGSGGVPNPKHFLGGRQDLRPPIVLTQTQNLWMGTVLTTKLFKGY